MGFRGSRIGSNLFNFSNVFYSFLFIFFTLVLGVHFGAFWVPHGCKRGSKRPQGHPFGQQKLTKLDLDHGCENMAPMQ